MREFEMQLLRVLSESGSPTDFITKYLSETGVGRLQVKNWLHEMQREGYINLSDHDLYKLATNELSDANFMISITSKGQDRLAQLNKKEVPSINIAGSVVNSQIGIQSDLLNTNSFKNKTTYPYINKKSINPPTEMVHGCLRKFIKKFIDYIWVIVLGVISCLIYAWLAKSSK
jgi:hypothetical protein